MAFLYFDTFVKKLLDGCQMMWLFNVKRMMRRNTGCVAIVGCGCFLIWSISFLGHMLQNDNRMFGNRMFKNRMLGNRMIGNQMLGNRMLGNRMLGNRMFKNRKHVTVTSRTLSSNICGNNSTNQGVITYKVNYKQFHAILFPVNESKAEVDLVILVPTRCRLDAAERRMVIRKTWANKTHTSPLKVQHVFLLGKLILLERFQ